jgi:hypothetical protein
MNNLGTLLILSIPWTLAVLCTFCSLQTLLLSTLTRWEEICRHGVLRGADFSRWLTWRAFATTGNHGPNVSEYPLGAMEASRKRMVGWVAWPRLDTSGRSVATCLLIIAIPTSTVLVPCIFASGRVEGFVFWHGVITLQALVVGCAVPITMVCWYLAFPRLGFDDRVLPGPRALAALWLASALLVVSALLIEPTGEKSGPLWFLGLGVWIGTAIGAAVLPLVSLSMFPNAPRLPSKTRLGVALKTAAQWALMRPDALPDGWMRGYFRLGTTYEVHLAEGVLSFLAREFEGLGGPGVLLAYASSPLSARGASDPSPLVLYWTTNHRVIGGSTIQFGPDGRLLSDAKSARSEPAALSISTLGNNLGSLEISASIRPRWLRAEPSPRSRTALALVQSVEQEAITKSYLLRPIGRARAASDRTRE